MKRTNAAAQLLAADLSPLQLRFAQRLHKDMGSWVPGRIAIDHVYALHEDGGPLRAENCLCIMRGHANKKLARVGLQIQGRGWRGYRLIWTDSP